MPEEQKMTWVKDLGVNYVELTSDPNLLQKLSKWGFVDLESVPENRRGKIWQRFSCISVKVQFKRYERIV